MCRLNQVIYTVESWPAKNTDYLPEGSAELLGKSTSAIMARIANPPSQASQQASQQQQQQQPQPQQAGGAGSARAAEGGAPAPVLGGGGAAGSSGALGTSFLRKATVADSFMRSMESLMRALRSPPPSHTHTCAPPPPPHPPLSPRF